MLRDLAARGVEAPRLAIGDGALGFWAALREVWPESQEQGCWVHRTANVLDKLPKRLQPRAKSQLHEIFKAERLKRSLRSRSKSSSRNTGTSTRRPWPRCYEIGRECSRSMTFQQPTGNRSEARMSSNRPSRLSSSDNASRKALVHEPRASRWRSSCWQWQRSAGEESAAHSSLSSCSKARSSSMEGPSRMTLMEERKSAA